MLQDGWSFVQGHGILKIPTVTHLRPAPADLPSSLRDVVDYRKSGLSLNHIVGCPLDCGYCVRHLFANYDMKQPHLVMNDEAAVELLTGHWAFRAGTTPLQLLNRATDPFLPGVKEHLLATLKELDRRELTNPVLVISRWRVDRETIVELEALRWIKLTILVTWSGIEDRRIEPVDSAIAEGSLQELAAHAKRTRKILYWRPLIAGVNDSAEHLARARELSACADATVFTGLFFRDEIRQHLREAGVPDLYPEIARRKILPREIEGRVLAAFEGKPLFRKTSCGVAYAHGLSDYNGHYGIREICDICPVSQLNRCAVSHQRPSLEQIRQLARLAGLDANRISLGEGRIEVAGSCEQQRYFIQHTLNYQVHDREHPHHRNRHGRAEIGWT